MALKPCRECEHQVSTLAPACPHCGAPNPAPADAQSAPSKVRSEHREIAVVGAILAAVFVLSILTLSMSNGTAGGGPRGLAGADTTALAEARAASRRADSVRRAELSARAADLTDAELLELDALMHRMDDVPEHDAVHTRALGVPLDSAAALLRQRPARFLEAEAVLLNLGAPLSEAQEKQHQRILKQIAEHRANGRAMMIRARSECKPTLQKVRASMQRHPGWTDDVLASILCGRIFLGMTAEQVRASWGRPYDINRSVYRSGVHEQWVYGEYGRSYVYFEDGVVTAIQN